MASSSKINLQYVYVEAKTTSKPNEIRLNCHDKISFCSFLVSIQDKVCYHTHAFPSQRTLKLVIKGIPLDISNQEITEEIESNGFGPTLIRAFFKNCLANIDQAKEIYQISKLFFVNVKIIITDTML
ncbi:unnamed protein product [Macrosiphum euphorbiae]|uniref:Uncharacterized protein n=1 Tax=Macrosiphum euphorbiae TaxID=13131 RepID=A0AAV0WJD9_9HEMI|nr:unnamed protein product [Macrosiphum euphorbiae]